MNPKLRSVLNRVKRTRASANPPDETEVGHRVDMLAAGVQNEGEEVGEMSEVDLLDAFEELGGKPGRGAIYMERLAGWSE